MTDTKHAQNLAQKFLLAMITLYRRAISPLLPARCRYYPTCSSYAHQAIVWHGAMVGGKLTLKRLARCHPWGGHGVDFVPVPMARYRYDFIGDDWVKMDGFVRADRYSYRTRLHHL
ncbi:MAG: membrane protein insertion efficiency factor YidD [Moraxella sp.]|nr:membrane protein insertion efficiency factor YidD [Moraxella sp.]